MHANASRRRMQYNAQRRAAASRSSTPGRMMSTPSTAAPRRAFQSAGAARTRTPGSVLGRQESVDLEARLENRPESEALAKSSIMRGGGKDPKIVNAASGLERKILEKRLTQHLESQPDSEVLKNKGIISRQDISSSLMSRAKTLERQVASNQIAYKIEARPESADLQQLNILNAKTAPSIQSTARMLERQMSADAVGQLLGFRPTQDELADAGVLRDTNMCKSLAATAHSLSREMAKDSVKTFLERRPSMDQLRQTGVVTGDPFPENSAVSIAPSIQARRKSLERKIASSNIASLLVDRADPGQLHMQNPNLFRRNPYIAPSVQSKAEQLDRNLKKSSLNLLLQERPTPDIMVQMGLMDPENLVPGQDAQLYADELLLDERTKFGILLKACKTLYNMSLLDAKSHSMLKDLIVNYDMRVMAAVEVFESDEDYEEMLDTLYRIANHARGQ